MSAMIIIFPIGNSVKETTGGCESYVIEITRSKQSLFAFCEKQLQRYPQFSKWI